MVLTAISIYFCACPSPSPRRAPRTDATPVAVYVPTHKPTKTLRYVLTKDVDIVG